MAAAEAAGSRSGRVVLVGAGPGSADLLTLRAARLLAEAEWVVHDALVQPDVLALAGRARLVDVGKRAGRRSMPQASINQTLVACARAGGLVVRLKGGDPLLFARAREELDALRTAGIEVEVVPGITAAQAAHAALAMPMTERGRRRAMVLATPQAVRAPDSDGESEQDADDLHWARALVNAGGGALYMAASAVARVRATLLSLGLPAATPATWMVDVSLPSQATVATTLGELAPLADALSGRPAMLLLGAGDGSAPSVAPCFAPCFDYRAASRRSDSVALQACDPLTTPRIR
jgi:uroporphyrin-III C-methyltransferase